ncbi:CBS domain-containing protein [Telmatospirillum sp. J64-1]|uniref:CBS domain-containing protein n=1 Tax=Telmatospirillum sp. J64-1 TaxID=2502183 RepID=UPI00115D0747|nr:CBS domain-containing protein [Telmatospirillum sp. J64-1]
MQVHQIMTPNIVVIPPDLSLRDVARKMRELDIGALPVGAHDRLVGMVTDRDITIRAVAEGRNADDTPVKEVMSPDIIYCYDDQEVEEAAAVMEREQVRRLPVINRDKRLVGILSMGDVSTRTGDLGLAGEVAKEVSQPS